MASTSRPAAHYPHVSTLSWDVSESIYYTTPFTYTNDRDLEAYLAGPTLPYQITDDEFDDENTVAPAPEFDNGSNPDDLPEQSIHPAEIDIEPNQSLHASPRSEVHFAPGTAPPASLSPSKSKKGILKAKKSLVSIAPPESEDERNARIERETLARQEAESKAKAVAAEKAARKEQERQLKKEALEAAKFLEAEKAAKRKEKLEKEKAEKARKAEQEKLEKIAKKEAAEQLKAAKTEKMRLEKEKQDAEKREKEEAAALTKKKSGESSTPTIVDAANADTVVPPSTPDKKSAKANKKDSKKDKKKEKTNKGKAKNVDSPAAPIVPASESPSQQIASSINAAVPPAESNESGAVEVVSAPSKEDESATDAPPATAQEPQAVTEDTSSNSEVVKDEIQETEELPVAASTTVEQPILSSESDAVVAPLSEQTSSDTILSVQDEAVQGTEDVSDSKEEVSESNQVVTSEDEPAPSSDDASAPIVEEILDEGATKLVEDVTDLLTEPASDPVPNSPDGEQICVVSESPAEDVVQSKDVPSDDLSVEKPAIQDDLVLPVEESTTLEVTQSSDPLADANTGADSAASETVPSDMEHDADTTPVLEAIATDSARNVTESSGSDNPPLDDTGQAKGSPSEDSPGSLEQNATDLSEPESQESAPIKGSGGDGLAETTLPDDGASPMDIAIGSESPEIVVDSSKGASLDESNNETVEQDTVPSPEAETVNECQEQVTPESQSDSVCEDREAAIKQNPQIEDLIGQDAKLVGSVSEIAEAESKTSDVEALSRNDGSEDASKDISEDTFNSEDGEKDPDADDNINATTLGDESQSVVTIDVPINEEVTASELTLEVTDGQLDAEEQYVNCEASKHVDHSDSEGNVNDNIASASEADGVESTSHEENLPLNPPECVENTSTLEVVNIEPAGSPEDGSSDEVLVEIVAPDEEDLTAEKSEVEEISISEQDSRECDQDLTTSLNQDFEHTETTPDPDSSTSSKSDQQQKDVSDSESSGNDTLEPVETPESPKPEQVNAEVENQVDESVEDEVTISDSSVSNEKSPDEESGDANIPTPESPVMNSHGHEDESTQELEVDVSSTEIPPKEDTKILGAEDARLSDSLPSHEVTQADERVKSLEAGGVGDSQEIPESPIEESTSDDNTPMSDNMIPVLGFESNALCFSESGENCDISIPKEQDIAVEDIELERDVKQDEEPATGNVDTDDSFTVGTMLETGFGHQEQMNAGEEPDSSLESPSSKNTSRPSSPGQEPEMSNFKDISTDPCEIGVSADDATDIESTGIVKEIGISRTETNAEAVAPVELSQTVETLSALADALADECTHQDNDTGGSVADTDEVPDRGTAAHETEHVVDPLHVDVESSQDTGNHYSSSVDLEESSVVDDTVVTSELGEAPVIIPQEIATETLDSIGPVPETSDNTELEGDVEAQDVETSTTEEEDGQSEVSKDSSDIVAMEVRPVRLEESMQVQVPVSEPGVSDESDAYNNPLPPSQNEHISQVVVKEDVSEEVGKENDVDPEQTNRGIEEVTVIDDIVSTTQDPTASSVIAQDDDDQDGEIAVEETVSQAFSIDSPEADTSVTTPVGQDVLADVSIEVESAVESQPTCEIVNAISEPSTEDGTATPTPVEENKTIESNDPNEQQVTDASDIMTEEVNADASIDHVGGDQERDMVENASIATHAKQKTDDDEPPLSVEEPLVVTNQGNPEVNDSEDKNAGSDGGEAEDISQIPDSAISISDARSEEAKDDSSPMTIESVVSSANVKEKSSGSEEALSDPVLYEPGEQIAEVVSSEKIITPVEPVVGVIAAGDTSTAVEPIEVSQEIGLEDLDAAEKEVPKGSDNIVGIEQSDADRGEVVQEQAADDSIVEDKSRKPVTPAGTAQTPEPEQITQEPLVAEPDQIEQQALDQPQSPDSASPQKRRHRSSRHSSHRHSSSRDLPSASASIREELPIPTRKRRDSESGKSLKTLISALTAGRTTTPPPPQKPIRVDSGIDTGSTSSHGKHRKRRSTSESKSSPVDKEPLKQEEPKRNSRGRTVEEQKAHDKRKAERRASRLLEKEKADVTVPVPVAPPSTEATSFRRLSSRRQSTSRSHGSSMKGGDPSRSVEVEKESVVKTATFLASDLAMVKETREVLPKSASPVAETVDNSLPPPVAEERSNEKTRERSERPKLDDRERRSSRRHTSSSHPSSSRKDRDRGVGNPNDKVSSEKIDKEREARRVRREEEKRLASERIKIQEEARVAKEKEDEERSARRAERRRKRAEEEQRIQEQERLESQKRAEAESSKKSVEKLAFDVSKEKRKERKEKTESTRSTEKSSAHDRDRGGGEVVRERGERVHRSSTRRVKEAEREREKSKGGLSSLWMSAKKAFT